MPHIFLLCYPLLLKSDLCLLVVLDVCLCV